VTAGDPPDRVARRVAEVAAFFDRRRADVVTTDAELPVDSGYGERLHDLGFVPVEEVQPARHRLSLRLDGASEEAVHAAIAKATRQRIRRAEEAGQIVRRFDARMESAPGPGFRAGPAAELGDALRRFHGLVRATGDRRGFRLGPVGPFVAWLAAAHAAGHAILLEAQAPGATGGPGTDPRGGPLAGGPVIAGLLLYRQGDRLSTVISGDDEAARASHPGALHLLRWRAIQLAIRESRPEMDLGGVDVAGARHEPRPGESMYGLYEHKRSFGAVFVEQVGAHQRVLRPVHHTVARTLAAITGRLRS
jgi:lipid II:glycine glycyltransferase (peptidoglycan interpeptide bridge formation enzyme)